MVVPGVSRRGFLGSALATAASLTTGNVSDSSGRLHAQEPPKQLEESKLRLHDPRDFNKYRDKTLSLAEKLFKDIRIWNSLSANEQKDFCTRLHSTMLFDEGKDPNEATSKFLINLNSILRSDSIPEELKENLFKLDNYLMLDLGFIRITKFHPDPQITRSFLGRIIEQSGTIKNGNAVRPISFGQKIQDAQDTTQNMRKTYQEIKKEFFPDS